MSAVKDARKIETVALTHVDDIEQNLRGDVLTKAYQEFGYQGNSFGAKGPLAKALAKLDIHPLKTEQVKQYQESKRRQSISMAAKRAMIFWAATALLVTSAQIVAGHYWKMGLFEYAFSTVVSLLVLGFIWHALIEDAFDNYRKSWDWTSFALGKNTVQIPDPEGTKFSHRSGWTVEAKPYGRYVPVHVLNLALQIKNECPSTAFLVEELTMSVNEVPRPLPDPFLAATLGSEKYYIAVWDEREFEAKM